MHHARLKKVFCYVGFFFFLRFRFRFTFVCFGRLSYGHVESVKGAFALSVHALLGPRVTEPSNHTFSAVQNTELFCTGYL